MRNYGNPFEILMQEMMAREHPLKPTPEKQRILEIAAPIIIEKLLKPRGIAPPSDLKVLLDAPNMIPSDKGLTGYRRSGRRKADPDASAEFSAVSSAEGSALEAVGTLAHELIHASLPFGVDGELGDKMGGHGPTFASHARAIGLVGPIGGTVTGPVFKTWFAANVAPCIEGLTW